MACEPIPAGRRSYWSISIWLVATIALAGWLWRAWPDIQVLIQDEAALEAYVVQLGWWGPPVLVGINVLQIVVAPIPGYAVYIVGGFLYGTLWGGILGTIGLVLGGGTAMLLARRFGRPLVVRVVGVQTLARWEEVVHSDSMVMWGLLMLSPIGDSPYYLAGLSRVGLGRILLLAVMMRGPQAFIIAALGRGAFNLTWWQIGLLTLLLALPILLFLRFGAWFTRRIRKNNARAATE